MELSDHESRLKRCHLFIATIGFIGLALTLTSCGGGGNSPSSGTGGTLSIGGPTITSLNPSGGSVNLSASQVTAVGYTIEGRAFYASHNASGVAGVLLADGSTFVPLPLDLQPSVTQYNVTAFVQNGWVAGVCGPRGGGSGNQFAYAFNPTTGQKYVKVGLNAPECVSSEGMLVLATFTNSSSGNKMTGHVLVQLSTGAQSVLPSSTNAYTVLRRNVHGAVLFTEFISGPSVKEIVEKRATLALAPARKKAFGSGGVNKGFYWAGFGPVVSVLPVSGDAQALVADMNDDGLVIGVSINSDGSIARPCYWVHGGRANELTLPAGMTSGMGESVNNAGNMFGTTFPTSGSIHATAWSGSSCTPETVGTFTDIFTAALTGGHIMAQDNTTGTVQDMVLGN